MIMGASFREMPEIAAIYEENGLESLWMPEHLVFPAQMPPLYPYTDSGYPVVTPDTGPRTNAAIEVLRRLWSEEVIEVHDEHFDFGR
jgi:alkanesulfonate monooxygenase SsuD/methylene tetrahydromethanopterin reductase-like flavin-dependent oxidoreductase (luciferase family)